MGDLTRDERRQLDEAIYKIFPEIENYEAGILDRVVEKIVAAREYVAWGSGHTTRCVGTYSCKRKDCYSNPHVVE